jgi:hypothetical protein
MCKQIKTSLDQEHVQVQVQASKLGKKDSKQTNIRIRTDILVKLESIPIALTKTILEQVCGHRFTEPKLTSVCFFSIAMKICLYE